MKTITVATMILASLTSNVFAKNGDTDFIVGGASYHYNRAWGMNETNPSFGVKFANGVSLVYIDQNSVENNSLQVGYGNNFLESKYIDFGYRVGFATGYQKGSTYGDHKVYSGRSAYKGILPIVALETSIDITKDTSAVVDITPLAVFLGATYKL